MGPKSIITGVAGLAAIGWIGWQYGIIGALSIIGLLALAWLAYGEDIKDWLGMETKTEDEPPNIAKTLQEGPKPQTNYWLIPCKTCGQLMARRAKACPHCGQIRTTAFTKIIAGLFGVLVLVLIFVSITLPDRPQTPAVASRPMPPHEIVYNSPLDGSVRQVEDYLRKNLTDPDSLKVDEWSPVVKEGNGVFMVRCRYRAKNSFGGYVLTNTLFALSPSGVVVSARPLEK